MTWLSAFGLSLFTLGCAGVGFGIVELAIRLMTKKPIYGGLVIIAIVLIMLTILLKITPK